MSILGTLLFTGAVTVPLATGTPFDSGSSGSAGMGWEAEVSAIEERYDATVRQGEIVFYGASNFARWTEMETDLFEYKLQNHAFGGSSDRDLVDYADRLLYPYAPAVVVFQTGSNDYVRMTGSDDEKLAAVMDRKRQMFESVHAALPNAQLIVMSGILMPGRAEYTPLIKRINTQLETLAAGSSDYITYVNAEKLTWDGTRYDVSLFVSDGIHLTHAGRLRWADEYIRPALEDVIVANQLDNVRR